MDEPVVCVEHGKLRGRIVSDVYAGEFYSFQGIPYAKPPIDRLRFKAPQEPESWSGIRDATQEGSECYARHLIYRDFCGSEDCLYLNVYTPQIKNATKGRDVMVFVHGGSFTGGSSKTDIYGPEFLVAEDVVLVTFNYRVGVLGFLSLEDPGLNVPGNAGFKDMVMVLRWVKKNIKHFGGDPENVTVFGESAGGAAVHYLVLSPMAKGLFHKAIMQSGSVLNNWSMGARIAPILAKVLRIESTDENKILKELRQLKVEQLVKAMDQIDDAENLSRLRPVGLVIEKPSDEEAFLTEHPLTVLKNGAYNKMPIIMGYCDFEGMMFFVKPNAKKLPRVLNDFEMAVPHELKLEKSSTISKIVAEKIKTFYYGDDEPGMHNLLNYYKLMTDGFFTYGIFKSVQWHQKNNNFPTYFYRMSLESSLNMYKTITGIQFPGASHADDLGYLFKTQITPEILLGSDEEKYIKRFTVLWTNFAKYGNPNGAQNKYIKVNWKPVETSVVNILHIDKELTLSDFNPDLHRMKFWDEIYAFNPAISKL